jgi:nitrite reductase (NADH) small subunit
MADMSGAERDICALSDIPPGEGRLFEIAGRQVAVFHMRSGEVFATQAECPHRGGPLADGLVGGTTLICPLHERSYDLRTGAGIGNEECLAVYPARAEAGRVLVGLQAAKVG